MKENFNQIIDKKQAYFTKLGLSVREALKMHEKAGLWEQKDGKRDWGNVSEHCLVAAARVDILGSDLNLPDDVQKDLVTAAALHDFFKKEEKEIVSTEGLTWESFEKASDESTRQMQIAGFNDRTIHIANSIAHDSLKEMESILNQGSLSPEDIACLLLHYVDDYTIGSEWASQAEMSPNGQIINDLDKRMDKNESNPRYVQVNEDGKKRFNGETSYQAQRRIGHLVEKRITDLIKEKTGQTISPKDLPQFIDKKIQDRISRL